MTQLTMRILKRAEESRSRLGWSLLLAVLCSMSTQCKGEQSSSNQERAKRKSDPFMEKLHARFGKKLYSRHDDELFIRDYFDDKRGGFFVDVGAYDYKKNSNTYYLEKQLGWSGIAIDAQPEFAEGYRMHRPNTKFVSYFISDKSDGTVDFFVPDNKTQATGVEASLGEKKHSVQRVRTLTLNDLLQKERVGRLDFLSIDIESAEPAALAGFDIERYLPSLVCIETSHRDVRDAIYDYFRKYGYVEIKEYSMRDPFNSYFKPGR